MFQRALFIGATFVFVSGCEGDEKDTDRDTLTASNCPSGYSPATEGSAVTSNISLDGATRFTTFDPAQLTDFGLGGCHKDDGNGGRWVLTNDEGAWARITVEKDLVGNYTAKDDAGVTIELLQLDNETPVFDQSNMVQGTWAVNSIGKRFTVGLDIVGQTSDPAHNLLVNAQLSVSGTVSR